VIWGWGGEEEGGGAYVFVPLEGVGGDAVLFCIFFEILD